MKKKIFINSPESGDTDESLKYPDGRLPFEASFLSEALFEGAAFSHEKTTAIKASVMAFYKFIKFFHATTWELSILK